MSTPSSLLLGQHPCEPHQHWRNSSAVRKFRWRNCAAAWPDLPNVASDIDAQAEVQIKYAGYVNRQLEIVERFKKMEHARLPEDIDYSKISGLSREVCEKLMRIKPRSLGQAARISGVTPAAVTLLSFFIKKATKTA